MEYVLYLYEFTLLSNVILLRLLHGRVLYLYEFTLLSNNIASIATWLLVLYLYEFTLLSNRLKQEVTRIYVLYLYEFTLLSNRHPYWIIHEKSYTSMNLHYSQTQLHIEESEDLSYTSMNLHYSQTSNFENPACNWYVNPHLCYTFLYNKYQHISF